MYYILFIHSSVDGQLGCFCFLAIVNNDAMNIGIQVSMCVPVFNSFGSCSNSVFNFLRNCQTFPQWLHHCTFPPAMHEGSNFSTSLPALVIFHFCFQIIAILAVCEVLAHCGFDLHFSND